MLWKILLSMILLTSQTHAMDEKQILLKKTEKAPYEGVLIPPTVFKEIMVDVHAGDRFKDEFEKCSTDFQSFKNENDSKKLYYFTGGALTVIALEIILLSLTK